MLIVVYGNIKITTSLSYRKLLTSKGNDCDDKMSTSNIDQFL
jgi:hypothetical protein